MLSINNTTEGYLKNVEIKGNTIQGTDLADIRSVGDKIEGQDLYEIPLLCTGKNLFDGKLEQGDISSSTGSLVSSSEFARSVNFHKVTKGSNVVCGKGSYSSSLKISMYDSKLNYIGCHGNLLNTTSNTVKLDDRCCFVKLVFWKSGSLDISQVVNIQLEEGTQATTYEPYQEDKITILSPCQIEKVGDVADRIVEKDGVWGVEKNVESVVLNGSETWAYHSTLTNTRRFQCKNLIKQLNKPGVSDRFLYNESWNLDEEHFRFTHEDIVIWFGIDKVINNDTSYLKEWLNNNNTCIKYPTATPQFIPLPHSQQVKLRTFANRTNISFLTEIEGTIKADVPKSLGATVNTHTTQIDSLNQELERVKKLEESTVSTVVTDKDFEVVEQTTQGYFEDVELKGRTLVNLGEDLSYDKGSSSINISSDRRYTVLLDKKSTTKQLNCRFFYSDGTAGGDYKIANIDYIGRVTHIVDFSKSDKSKTVVNIGVYIPAVSSGDYSDFMILEGDHTQNPPSTYWEGLASVGDGTDEIVVSSMNENLFNSDFIKVVPSSTLVISNTSASVNVSQFDCDYKLITSYHVANNQSLTVRPNTQYIKIDTKENIQVEYGTTPKPYTPHKADKKKLLYFDPTDSTWKKPILDEFSTVKKGSDGVYRYYKRGEKVVLNGSEDWVANSLSNGIALFTLPLKSNGVNNFMCDKFSEGVGDTERMSTDGNFLYVRISVSKLTTQDLAGFKAWLQDNNVTVVYQLDKEQVYECTNIDLITYQNETNFNVKSGVLSPQTTLKVHSNISNVVSLLQKKVSLLESNMNGYMVIQNRLMLESRYSADSVTFKVDYQSMVEEKATELDYDLFNLLKANVLVGKDNYDYEKMINKIDFYQSISMIDWDMWDEIWLIMEIQHNPPVEEVPEETPEI